MTENEIGDLVVAGAMRVHTVLGPCLLESTYEACLAHEFAKSGVRAKRQVALPVVYDGVQLDAGYRLDLIVEDLVIVELKVVDRLLPVHVAQLLSYLKLSGSKLGYLLNFNVAHMKDGVKRVVNGL